MFGTKEDGEEKREKCLEYILKILMPVISLKNISNFEKSF